MGVTYNINVHTKELEILITGISVFFAMRSSFTVPLSNVELPIVPQPSAAQKPFFGFRFGTYNPMLFSAGTFWLHDIPGKVTKTFLYIFNSKRTIMFNLKNSNYERVIIQVPANIQDITQEAERLTRLIEQIVN